MRACPERRLGGGVRQAELERVVARAEVGSLEHEWLPGQIDPREAVERVDVGGDTGHPGIRQSALMADVVERRARRGRRPLGERVAGSCHLLPQPRREQGRVPPDGRAQSEPVWIVGLAGEELAARRQSPSRDVGRRDGTGTPGAAANLLPRPPRTDVEVELARGCGQPVRVSAGRSCWMRTVSEPSSSYRSPGVVAEIAYRSISLG